MNYVRLRWFNVVAVKWLENKMKLKQNEEEEKTLKRFTAFIFPSTSIQLIEYAWTT